MAHTLSTEQKNLLLTNARASIAAGLKGEHLESAEPVSDMMKAPAACFVTLHLNGELRGCIGSMEPWRGLLEDVIHNAAAAAFKDHRFHPVSADEWPKLEIEISVLSATKQLNVASREELLKWLDEHRTGLVVELPPHRATFLPQVWQQLPEPEQFLEHLWLKAGLSPDVWEPELQLQYYTVECFNEREMAQSLVAGG